METYIHVGLPVILSLQASKTKTQIHGSIVCLKKLVRCHCLRGVQITVASWRRWSCHQTTFGDGQGPGVRSARQPAVDSPD